MRIVERVKHIYQGYKAADAGISIAEGMVEGGYTANDSWILEQARKRGIDIENPALAAIVLRQLDYVVEEGE